jgi:hypothetical protein
MPGPVSDSYDPEFGTGANAADVAEAIQGVIDRATEVLGEDRKYIVEVAQGEPGRIIEATLTERDWRIVRFGLTRALETI